MSPERPPVRVASWPHWYGPNPYLPLLYRALEPHGIAHVRDVDLDPSAFTGDARVADGVHLHWAYPLWREGPGRTRAGRLRRALDRIRAIREAGVPIAWTVHNLLPHEDAWRGEREAYAALHELVDLRVFHSESARDEARTLFGPVETDSIVQYHGNWDGALPPGTDRAVVRAREGLPADARVLLCFGQIREYKGFDRAVDALFALNASSPATYHLVIAGRPLGDAARALERRTRGSDDVTLVLREISDQRLADLLGAADAVLLPYRSITGSGVLLHALTAGRGVVATDLPYFREVLARGPAAGELVGQSRDLADGVRAFFARDLAERQAAARELADRFAWPIVVEPLVGPLRQLLRPNTRESQPSPDSAPDRTD